MIATLPMYDWAELAPANDRLWAMIRDELRAGGLDAPDALTRDASLWELWQSPALLLGQTCGMPYRTRLHGLVTLVGTPDYGLPDAPPGYYYSVLVIRKGDDRPLCDFAARTLAYNGQDSQSGWAAPQNHAAGLGFRFVHTLHTGAHRDSAIAVADGRASIAAIDAVTWRYVQRFMPHVAEPLQVIARTGPTPGLPLITARANSAAPFYRASAAAIDSLSAEDRSTLGIQGLVQIDAAAYLAVRTPLPPSQDPPQN